ASVATSVLFGLIPALKMRGFNAAALKDAGRSTSDSPGRHRTRNTLVIAQVALALVLLVVSGLMARTFFAVRQANPGYGRPEDVQRFTISLPMTLIRDQRQVAQIFEQMSERLRQIPGVTSVGVGASVPMSGAFAGAPIFLEERAETGTPPMRRGKAF